MDGARRVDLDKDQSDPLNFFLPERDGTFEPHAPMRIVTALDVRALLRHQRAAATERKRIREVDVLLIHDAYSVATVARPDLREHVDFYRQAVARIARVRAAAGWWLEGVA